MSSMALVIVLVIVSVIVSASLHPAAELPTTGDWRGTYSVNPSKIAKTVPQLPEIARSGIEL